MDDATKEAANALDACQICAPYAVYHTAANHNAFVMKLPRYEDGSIYKPWAQFRNTFTAINTPTPDADSRKQQVNIRKEYAGLGRPMIDVNKFADQILDLESEAVVVVSPEPSTGRYSLISAEQSSLVLTFNEACDVLGIEEGVMAFKAEVKECYDDLKDYLYRHYILYGMPTSEEGVGKIEELEVAYAALKRYHSVTLRNEEDEEDEEVEEVEEVEEAEEVEEVAKKRSVKKVVSRKVSAESGKTATSRSTAKSKSRAGESSPSDEVVAKVVPLMSEIVAKAAAKKRTPAKKRGTQAGSPGDKVEAKSPENSSDPKKKAGVKKKTVTKPNTTPSCKDTMEQASTKRLSDITNDTDRPEAQNPKPNLGYEHMEGARMDAIVTTKSFFAPDSSMPMSTTPEAISPSSDTSFTSDGSTSGLKRGQEQIEGGDDSPTPKRAKLMDIGVMEEHGQGEDEVDDGTEADVEDEIDEESGESTMTKRHRTSSGWKTVN